MLTDVRQAFGELNRADITYLDLNFYRTTESKEELLVSERLSRIYEFLENTCLNERFIERILNRYGSEPYIDSFRKIDGRWKALMELESGKRLWINLKF